MAKLPPKYVPHQSRISVQNIKNYSTPQGSSAANEEFRRIGLAVNQLQDQLAEEKGKGDALGQAIKKVQDQLPEPDTAGGAIKNWATTVFDDTKRPVGPAKLVQGLTFVNSAVQSATLAWDVVGLDFLLESNPLDKLYSTVDGATNIRIRGRTYIDPEMAWRYQIASQRSRYSIVYLPLINKFQLVNDELAPGANQYYGTDSAGIKGWYPVEDDEIVDRVARLNLRNLFSEVAEAKSFVETWNVASCTMTATDMPYDPYFQNTIGGLPLLFSDVHCRGDRLTTEWTADPWQYTVFRAAIPGFYYNNVKYVTKGISLDTPPLTGYTRIELELQKKEWPNAAYAFESFIGHDFDKLLYDSTVGYVRVFQYQITGGALVWMNAGDRLRLQQTTIDFPPDAGSPNSIQYYVRWDIMYVGDVGINQSISKVNNWGW